MSTLGLDDRPARDDNLFQRLFWPGAEPSEVDTLGRQGFWLCLLVGLLSFVVLCLQSQPVSGLITLMFFWLGGIGVRERSVTAASYVAGAYLINIVGSVMGGGVPGALSLIAFGLLAANIRGTWVAAQWMKRAGAEAFPDRLSETLLDKIADRMPSAVWPKVKIVFFVLGAVFLLLSGVGIVMLAMRAHVPVT